MLYWYDVLHYLPSGDLHFFHLEYSKSKHLWMDIPGSDLQCGHRSFLSMRCTLKRHLWKDLPMEIPIPWYICINMHLQTLAEFYFCTLFYLFHVILLLYLSILNAISAFDERERLMFIDRHCLDEPYIADILLSHPISRSMHFYIPVK